MQIYNRRTKFPLIDKNMPHAAISKKTVIITQANQHYLYLSVITRCNSLILQFSSTNIKGLSEYQKKSVNRD